MSFERTTRRVVLVLVLGLNFCRLGVGPVQASSNYVEIATFSDGVGELVVFVEYRDDHGRVVSVRLNHEPYGSSFWFHEKEMQQFIELLAAAGKVPPGKLTVLGGIHSTAGSTLRIDALNENGGTKLTLTRVPDQGDSYPSFAISLKAEDFGRLQKAVAEANRKMIGKKP